MVSGGNLLGLMLMGVPGPGPDPLPPVRELHPGGESAGAHTVQPHGLQVTYHCQPCHHTFTATYLIITLWRPSAVFYVTIFTTTLQEESEAGPSQPSLPPCGPAPPGPAGSRGGRRGEHLEEPQQPLPLCQEEKEHKQGSS